MNFHFLIFVGSTFIFRVLTLNFFFIIFSAVLRFYKRFYALRENILHAIVNVQVPIYKALMPKNKKWQYAKIDLLKFPDGTLGKAVGDFLQTNEFDFIPFLETHDVFHVLLGYKTTIADEARLYFFLLGNGKYSFEVVGTVAASLVLLPELLFDFEKHYHRGKNCARINHRHFKNQLAVSIEILKEQIFNSQKISAPINY